MLWPSGREAKPRLSSENRLVRQRIEEFSILQYSICVNFRFFNMPRCQIQYTLPFVRSSRLVYLYRENEDMSS